MSKIFIICCVLLGLCYAEETRRIYIKSISVATKKENGKAWDLVGKQPDIQIELYQKDGDNWKKVFTSAVFNNKNTLDQIINTETDISLGKSVKINLVDVDNFQNDLIGSYEFKIDVFLSPNGKKVSFGSVESFSYIVSRYKTLAEHQKYQNQGDGNSEWQEKYEQLQEQSTQWQEEMAKWQSAYENKTLEYEQLEKQGTQWQEKSTEWQIAYEDKTKEYEQLQKQSAQKNTSENNTDKYEELATQSAKWQKAYEDKTKEYEQLQKQNTQKNTYENKTIQYEELVTQSAKWQKAYEDKTKEYEQLQKQSTQKNTYENKTDEYSQLQKESKRWQKNFQEKTTAYENKVQEYNQSEKQSKLWQKNLQEKTTAYENKVKEYNQSEKQSKLWQKNLQEKTTAYENKVKEYSQLQKQSKQWQEQSNKWEKAYKEKSITNNTTSNNTNSTTSNNTNSTHSNNQETIKPDETGPITKEEKEAQRKLDGIFRWAGSDYAKKSAQKMTNYYNQAVPFAKVLQTYPNRNKKHLDKFIILKTDMEKAVNAKKIKDINGELTRTKYYLDKNNKWLQYYAANPQESDKITVTQAKQIANSFIENLKMGVAEFKKLEKKHGKHPILDNCKKEWKTCQENIIVFLNKIDKNSSLKYFKDGLKKQKESLNEGIQKYDSSNPNPNILISPAKSLIKLEIEAKKLLGIKHTLWKQIYNESFKARKWLITAYCDRGIKARKNNNVHFMTQNFNSAEEIINGDKELQELYAQKVGVSSNLEKADVELKKLRSGLLERILKASTQISGDFTSYQKTFEVVAPNRQDLLYQLDKHKGKIISDSNFNKLSWSSNGWFLRHNGMFAYSWDADVWKKFREIELEHYKIFRKQREKILKKHKVDHLGNDGRIDWRAPELRDITFIAVIENKSSSYTGRRKIRDSYGRVIAQVDEKPIQVVRLRIVGIRSKYYTVWSKKNSHENLDLNGIID